MPHNLVSDINQEVSFLIKKSKSIILKTENTWDEACQQTLCITWENCEFDQSWLNKDSEISWTITKKIILKIWKFQSFTKSTFFKRSRIKTVWVNFTQNTYFCFITEVYQCYLQLTDWSFHSMKLVLPYICIIHSFQ